MRRHSIKRQGHILEIESRISEGDKRMEVQMGRVCLLLFSGLISINVHAKTPSQMTLLSCLAAQTMSPSMKFRPIATDKSYSEEDYKDGYDATYYIIFGRKRIGYAERGEEKAIIYGDHTFPIARARMVPGFDVRPTQLNPFSADWAIIDGKEGSYLCVSFPFGDLGQSGSSQKYRSAYLIAVDRNQGRSILYAATGSIIGVEKKHDW